MIQYTPQAVVGEECRERCCCFQERIDPRRVAKSVLLVEFQEAAKKHLLLFEVDKYGGLLATSRLQSFLTCLGHYLCLILRDCLNQNLPLHQPRQSRTKLENQKETLFFILTRSQEKKRVEFVTYARAAYRFKIERGKRNSTLLQHQ